MKLRLRSIILDNYAVLHLSRLLAISIPFIIVTFSHMLNAIGVGVPEILLEPTFDLALIASGAVIAVLGVGGGLLPLFLLMMILWGIWAYIYISYVLNLI